MKKWSLEVCAWAGLIVLFFGLLGLGQLQRFQLTPGIAIYGHDGVVLLGLGLSLLTQRQLRHFKPSLLPWSRWRLELLLVGWIGMGWVSAALQQHSVAVGVLYTARLVAYTGFTAVLLQAPIWPRLPQQWLGVSLKNLAYWLVGIAMLYLGFLQYLLIPDTRFLGMIGWDNHYYRLIGTLLDPGFTGMVLVITLLITTALHSKAHWSQWARWLLLGGVTLGIALTYSRASYLALAAGIITLAGIRLWQTRQLAQELLLLLLLAGLIVLIPRPGGEGVNLARTSTIIARVTNSQENVTDLTLIQRVIGRGLFVPEKIESQNTQRPDLAKLPDNLVVLLVSNLGIGGTGLICLWLLQHRSYWQTLPPFAQASVVALLVHTQFNNTLFQPFIFLILMGILLSFWLDHTRG